LIGKIVYGITFVEKKAAFLSPLTRMLIIIIIIIIIMIRHQ